MINFEASRLAQGMEAGRRMQQDHLDEQNALAAASALPAAMQGDQRALSRLAQVDPRAYMTVSSQLENRRRWDAGQAEAAERRREVQAQREQALADQEAAKRQVVNTRILTAMDRAYQSGNRTVFDSLSARLGHPGMSWDTYEQVAPGLPGFAGVYASRPEVKQVEPKLTEGADGYAYWVSPGQQPQRAIPGIEAAPSEPMVTVNTGDQTDKFRDELDKKDATFWSGVQDTGFAADRMLTRLSRLEDTLANAPTGVQGAITSFANSLGLEVPGGDEVAAAEAIINQLVPEQRQPGSGPMSDRDLEMFKRSLPSIINQPGGNAKIIQTMRAIAAYDREGVEISSRVFSGEISRQEGRRLLMGRADPLKDLRLGTTSDEEDTPPPPPPPEEPAALIGTTVNEPAGARRRDRRQPSGSQFDIDGATYTVRPAQ